MTMRNNQSGFSAVEELLILVIIGLVAFTGYFVWHSQKAANKTLDDTSKSTNADVQAQTKAVPVKNKEVCMPKEGLCASAPSGYSLEIGTVPKEESGLYSDLERMSIKNSRGSVVGNIDVAFPQVGGGCDPGFEKTQYLMEAFKTSAVFDVPADSQQDISQDVYAAKYILQKSKDSKVSYYPAVALTNQKVYEKGNFTTCPNTVYIGLVHFAKTKSPEGYQASLDAIVQGQAFDSKDAAASALDSADLTAVYSIFKSVRYQ